MVTKTARRIYSDQAIHPGEILLEEIEARGMSQRELAKRLGRPEQVISEIVHGKKGVTAETALGLEGVLDVSADFWLGLQKTYELTLARATSRRALAKRPAKRQAAKSKGKSAGRLRRS